MSELRLHDKLEYFVQIYDLMIGICNKWREEYSTLTINTGGTYTKIGYYNSKVSHNSFQTEIECITYLKSILAKDPPEYMAEQLRQLKEREEDLKERLDENRKIIERLETDMKA